MRQCDAESGHALNASFHEKSAWIQLISLIAVFAIAGWKVSNMMLNGNYDITDHAWVYGLAFVGLIVIIIAGHIMVSIFAVAIQGEDADTLDQADERDKIIQWRSDACTSWITGLGVVLAVILLVIDAESVWVANVLVGVGYINEVMKNLLQIMWYRRGSAMPV